MSQQKLPIELPLPTQVSKKELRQHLGYPLAAISHKALKRRIIKAGILTLANVSWDDIQTEQYLPPNVTEIIYEVWKIKKLNA